MKGNFKSFLPTTYQWTKNLGWKDLIQFKWEKQNLNVSGLNKEDFKFFDYDDPMLKTKLLSVQFAGNLQFRINMETGSVQTAAGSLAKTKKDLKRIWE